MAGKEALFSKMVKAGAKTYFIDVREAKNSDNKYVTISESQKKEDNTYSRSRVLLFGKSLPLIVEGLQEAAEVVGL